MHIDSRLANLYLRKVNLRRNHYEGNGYLTYEERQARKLEFLDGRKKLTMQCLSQA